MTREEAIVVLKAFMDNPLFSDVHRATFSIAIHDIKQRHEWDINNLILVNKDNYEPLEQEPTTKNDLALIHTEGLDEGIRCAMCTNSMKSDRGCDGGCVVNNAMYKEVMDVIENHIVDTDKMVEPTTKNNLGVDCISREQAKEAIRDKFKDLPSRVEINTILNELPSVTPQGLKTGHWIEPTFDMIHNHVCGSCEFICSSCNKIAVDEYDYCPNCGARMVEPQESEVENGNDV